MKDHYVCPICGKPGERSPRYPKYVCLDCATRAADKEGRGLTFGNVSISGGFVAWYQDNKEPYDSHICYVDGRTCWADEAHMGGIVVSVYDGPINEK
ncbi:MAG: hypothetical protein AB7Q37_04710 [Pyrinomonadaceae bacterium]